VKAAAAAVAEVPDALLALHRIAAAVAFAAAAAGGRSPARNYCRPQCLPWRKCHSPRSPLRESVLLPGFNLTSVSKRKDLFLWAVARGSSQTVSSLLMTS